jgi:hypothetical protein
MPSPKMPPPKPLGPPKTWAVCPECNHLFGYVYKRGWLRTYCSDQCKTKVNVRNYRLKYLKVNGVSYQHVEYVRRKKRNAKRLSVPRETPRTILPEIRVVGEGNRQAIGD